MRELVLIAGGGGMEGNGVGTHQGFKTNVNIMEVNNSQCTKTLLLLDGISGCSLMP